MITYCPPCGSGGSGGDSTVSIPPHNQLNGLQGGNNENSEFYHLNFNEQYSLFSTKVQSPVRVVSGGDIHYYYIKTKYPMYVGSNFKFVEIYDGDNLIDKSFYVNPPNAFKLGARTTTLSDTIRVPHAQISDINNVTLKYYEIETPIKPVFKFGRDDGRRITLRNFQNKRQGTLLKRIYQNSSYNRFEMTYTDNNTIYKYAPDWIKFEDLPLLLFRQSERIDQQVEVYIRGRNSPLTPSQGSQYGSWNPILEQQHIDSPIDIKDDGGIFYQLKRNIYYFRLRNIKYNIVTDQVKMRRLRCTLNNRKGNLGGDVEFDGKVPIVFSMND